MRYEVWQRVERCWVQDAGKGLAASDPAIYTVQTWLRLAINRAVSRCRSIQIDPSTSSKTWGQRLPIDLHSLDIHCGFDGVIFFFLRVGCGLTVEPLLSEPLTRRRYH